MSANVLVWHSRQMWWCRLTSTKATVRDNSPRRKRPSPSRDYVHLSPLHLCMSSLGVHAQGLWCLGWTALVHLDWAPLWNTWLEPSHRCAHPLIGLKVAKGRYNLCAGHNRTNRTCGHAQILPFTLPAEIYLCWQANYSIALQARMGISVWRCFCFPAFWAVFAHPPSPVPPGQPLCTCGPHCWSQLEPTGVLTPQLGAREA